MSCEHDCPRPPQFPKPIRNRPGLPRIDYRIGAYAEMRAHMFDLLSKATALAAWTHRGPDDPGIAFVESAAVVGDILTFYQNLYANELYLRTAQWRESVTELVRLLGYRLAPGLGGDAVFALAVKGDQPVTVPKDFGLKTQIEGQDKPAEFESTEEVVAYPHLSEFRVYRPYQEPGPDLATGMQEFAITIPGGTLPDFELKLNDRLLVGVPEPDATNPARLTNPEILIVQDSRIEFGSLIMRAKGGIVRNNGVQSLAAFKLGASYRHFGHNSPPSYISLASGTPPDITGNTTWYFRDDWEGDMNSVFFSMSPFTMRQVDFPLDVEVEGIAAGLPVIVQAQVSFPSDATAAPYTLIGKIAETRSQTLTYGSVSGSSTVLTLEDNLLNLIGVTPDYDSLRMDIRSISFHEVQGSQLELRAAPAYVPDASGTELAFFGTGDEVAVLEDRQLLLVDVDQPTAFVTVVGLGPNSLDEPDSLRHRIILLSEPVSYDSFTHADPTVTVYGNLVFSTQGKTQPEVVLGTGDHRQAFQTFSLPKAPLTYLLDQTQTPPQVPELSVYVDGIEWKRVETFFNVGPDDQVYVVREDGEKSFVQFGDGKTGARLSSGIKNVRVVYRVGSGAYGPLKAGTNPQATGKLANLDKPFLPSPVTGGSQPEDESNARVAAPGKMQSLGRMVSLSDIEAEALAIPSVIKVRAVWTAPEGVPLVRLTVLTESGEPADLDTVRLSLQTANRCHGPARFPIDAVQGVRQYCYLELEVGFDPARLEADILAAVKAALGLSGEEGNGIDGSEGLFGLKARQFGQRAYSSQIIAATQNVAGVRWVRLIAAQNLDLGDPPETDPAQLVTPTVDVVNQVLACPEDRLLALYIGHLILSLSKDEVAQECAS